MKLRTFMGCIDPGTSDVVIMLNVYTTLDKGFSYRAVTIPMPLTNAGKSTLKKYKNYYIKDARTTIFKGRGSFTGNIIVDIIISNKKEKNHATN